jgi:hypothetical protein
MREREKEREKTQPFTMKKTLPRRERDYLMRWFGSKRKREERVVGFRDDKEER